MLFFLLYFFSFFMTVGREGSEPSAKDEKIPYSGPLKGGEILTNSIKQVVDSAVQNTPVSR